ncbi:hypothetical protein SDC9_210549 [bioreactor metagenome]|uniref:Uncharacterized protein n=1 Tax=bioreactor metagenome TaxID=1076179 RepID=A0A645JH80_9ZZZZ
MAPCGLVFAEPDHRDVVDFLQDVDGPLFPCDADHAVEPTVGEVPDAVFGNHGDSGVFPRKRIADVLSQSVDVSAHHGMVRRFGHDGDLLAADADAGTESQLTRGREHPAACFGRNQRTVVEHPADSSGRHLRTRGDLCKDS